MKTKDWKSIRTPKALVIGHDPRLQVSDTIAPYALFADYYFNPIPTKPSEKRKYGLAKVTYDQITYITNSKINPDTIYVTNLCNYPLPHAPKNRMVYIPKDKAQEGIANIIKILNEHPTIEYVFPMSLQVNYWLQKLGYYDSNDSFIARSEPREKGIKNDPPYFEPKYTLTFLLICGNIYSPIEGQQKIIPILHSKQFPLNKKTIKYNPCYDRIREYFNSH